MMSLKSYSCRGGFVLSNNILSRQHIINNNNNNIHVVRKHPLLSIKKFTSSNGTATGQQQQQQFPIRNIGITVSERAALRAARKERATKFIAEQQQHQNTSTTTLSSSSNRGSSSSGRSTTLATSHYIWYLSIGIPTGLLVWGMNDEHSPPAQFCEMIGITQFIKHYTDEISQPVYDKLLPDWSQV